VSATPSDDKPLDLHEVYGERVYAHVIPQQWGIAERVGMEVRYLGCVCAVGCDECGWDPWHMLQCMN
jgi:hypothetical protein